MPFLTIAEMCANFQILGNVPVCKDMLKIKRRGFAIVVANSLSNRGWIESGPGDFDIFNLLSFFTIISSVN